MVLARSPPGTTVGGERLIPILNPVLIQSTHFIVFFLFNVPTAALTSFGTTSPLNIRQQAMYMWSFLEGLHVISIFEGSKTALDNSYVVIVS